MNTETTPYTIQEINDEGIQDVLWNESIAIGQIIWLAGLANDTDPLDAVFEDKTAAEILAIIPGLKLGSDYDKLSFDADFLYERITRGGKLGFLVSVSTPVRDGSPSFSWGHTYVDWLYTESLDAAFVLRLIDWKNQKNSRHAH